ncbi:hypothetical protein Tco_1380107, partial [Tanacetum coccineum]
AHDKEWTRADVWMLPADQSGADTSTPVSPYHAPLSAHIRKEVCYIHKGFTKEFFTKGFGMH